MKVLIQIIMMMIMDMQQQGRLQMGMECMAWQQANLLLRDLQIASRAPDCDLSFFFTALPRAGGRSKVTALSYLMVQSCGVQHLGKQKKGKRLHRWLDRCLEERDWGL